MSKFSCITIDGKTGSLVAKEVVMANLHEHKFPCGGKQPKNNGQ